MGLSKIVAAATGAVVLAGGGTFLALNHSDGAAPTHVSTHVTTPATTVAASAPATQPLPSAVDVTKSILDLTQQLQQAAQNGGQPQALTPDQVNALLQAQLAQLGLKS
jgi:hypothetical protein